MATFGGANIVTDNLVLWLDAANRRSYPGSGTTWTDMSGNNNSGSLVNGPTFSSANGGSIVFDGVNDYVDCGSGNQITGLINLTVSAWVYPVTSSTNPIISRYFNTTLNNGIILTTTTPSVVGNIKASLQGRESSAEYLLVTSSLDYPLNRWYNVAGTKNANTWSIYVNGMIDGIAVIGNGTTQFAQNNLQIGALIGSGFSLYGKSNISNAMIYNRALSPSEITQNYNALKSRYLNQY